MPLHEAVVGNVRPRLLILITAVALVLVIAGANVANLRLSRAVMRQREIAIRTAIGATPRRIARQLLTESVVLALLGAIVGLLFAGNSLAVLKLVLPPDTPRLDEVGLNWRVLVFTGALAILTGCAFGLAPVLQAMRPRLHAALDSGDRAGGPAAGGFWRAGLTVAQIACAVLLVIAAGLLVRSLWTLSRADPGFRPDQVITARISPPESVCATVGSLPRLLSFIGYAASGGSGRPRCRAREHAAADRGGRQAVAGARRVHARETETCTLVLAACDHARLFPRHGHSCRVRTCLHERRSHGASRRRHRHLDHGAPLLARSEPDRQAGAVRRRTPLAHDRRRGVRPARVST